LRIEGRDLTGELVDLGHIVARLAVDVCGDLLNPGGVLVERLRDLAGLGDHAFAGPGIVGIHGQLGKTIEERVERARHAIAGRQVE
jgi:hypothetical protein